MSKAWTPALLWHYPEAILEKLEPEVHLSAQPSHASVTKSPRLEGILRGTSSHGPHQIILPSPLPTFPSAFGKPTAKILRCEHSAKTNRWGEADPLPCFHFAVFSLLCNNLVAEPGVVAHAV